MCFVSELELWFGDAIDLIAYFTLIWVTVKVANDEKFKLYDLH